MTRETPFVRCGCGHAFTDALRADTWMFGKNHVLCSVSPFCMAKCQSYCFAVCFLQNPRKRNAKNKNKQPKLGSPKQRFSKHPCSAQIFCSWSHLLPRCFVRMAGPFSKESVHFWGHCSVLLFGKVLQRNQKQNNNIRNLHQIYCDRRATTKATLTNVNVDRKE